jgi:hypothetical protein
MMLDLTPLFLLTPLFFRRSVAEKWLSLIFLEIFQIPSIICAPANPVWVCSLAPLLC